MSSTLTPRRSAALAGLALVASLITPSAAQAAPADTPSTSTNAAEVGAGYLIRQLTAQSDGTYLTSWGYPDYGLTIDAVLALTAAGVGKDTAAAATDHVAANVGAYTSYDTDVYSGSVAKAAFLAQVQGRDATSFGGKDLITTLLSLKAENGRFMDKVSNPAYEYSNTFGQSFAILALARAGRLPADAVTFLAGEQCGDGGFPMYAEGANRAAGSPCVSDPDATSMAVQALIAANGVGDPAAARGLDSLAAAQGSNGGVGSTGEQSAANGNSTGLAGQAFLGGGRAANARSANTFLSGLAYDCSFPAALRGGIAYDAAARQTQVAAGAAAAPADVDRRSTAQAVLSLAGTPLYALTNSGALAVAPVLQCTDPSPTSSPTTTTSTSSPTTTPTSTPSVSPTMPTHTPTVAPTNTSTVTTAPTTAPTSPTVAPSTTTSAVVVPVSSPSVTTSTPGPGTLPFTGSESLRLVLLGTALLLLGSIAVVVTRRRGSHS